MEGGKAKEELKDGEMCLSFRSRLKKEWQCAESRGEKEPYGAREENEDVE
jgi:hypothetical protein